MAGADVHGRTALDVEAAAFDVFGTLVDWRSGIIEAGRQVGAETGVDADWAAVADDWRSRYRPALDRVRSGERPWANFTELHRETLDDVLADQGVTELDGRGRDRLTEGWSRLPPWPDCAPGLAALRDELLVVTLSNGHMGMLARLAKHAGLTFDLVLSAELAGTYKPGPSVYRTAARLLDLPPSRVLMVAAHPYDLRGAASAGMRTAYVPRPAEWGPDGPEPAPPDTEFDLVATDLEDLAARLAWSRRH